MSAAPLRSVPLRSRGAVEQRLQERLDAGLRQLRTLGDVLTWCRAQDPVLLVAGIVTQDEYTHDVIVRHDARHWLVFDTT